MTRRSTLGRRAEEGRTGPGELRLPGMVLGGVLVVTAFALLAEALSAIARGRAGSGYDTWIADLPRDLGARLWWALGDVTEPQFYKSPAAAVGLLAGAALAWWAGRRGHRWAGQAISYGSGLWPWVLGGASLSLLLSNLAFGWRLEEGWQPTFVPFVCVATAVVLVYGRGWHVLLTGAVLGAATTTPIAMILIDTVTGPVGLPSVVANTAAMSVGTAMSFLLCRVLPWMRRVPAPEQAPAPDSPPIPATRRTVLQDAMWTVRRVVTDFTETQFYANELASVGLLAGLTVAVVLDASSPAYGTGLVPQILLAQVLTSAIGVILWRRHYRAGGWVPTYISVVSVAPATVLAYGGALPASLVGAVAGAVLCPAIARPISARLPKDFHPFIGNTISMAVATSVIVPAVGLIPGVG